MNANLKRSAIYILILLAVTLIGYRLISFGELNSKPFYLTVLWLLVTGLMVILLNNILGILVDRFFNWKKYAALRFFLQLLLGTLFSLACLNASYFLLKSYFTEIAPSWNQIILLNIYGASLILPVFAVRFGYKFLRAWKKSELEYEVLQKENARSQMMTLRNHLDPHFLFNNLNILSSLIDKDVVTSKSYLDKFAEVYRIILRTEYSDLTTVRDELKLIHSYMYLLKIRFENAVFFDVNISEDHKDMAIPPLSIQMLIENAIKHNIVSEEKPIHLEITAKNDELRVKNNLQKKKYLDSKRKGTGIDNIKKRYQFFTERAVQVVEDEYQFEVILPILEIEEM